MVAYMRVEHYDNTRFGTNDWLCMLLNRYAIVTIVPNLGRPGLCYYRGYSIIEYANIEVRLYMFLLFFLQYINCLLISVLFVIACLRFNKSFAFPYFCQLHFARK